MLGTSVLANENLDWALCVSKPNAVLDLNNAYGSVLVHCPTYRKASLPSFPSWGITPWVSLGQSLTDGECQSAKYSPTSGDLAFQKMRACLLPKR